MCPRSRLIEVGREVGGECDERRQEKERELADILTEARDFPSLSDARRPFPRIFVCVPSSSRSRSREGKYIARGSATRGGKSRRGRINEEFARTLSLSLSLSLLFSSPLSPLLSSPLAGKFTGIAGNILGTRAATHRGNWRVCSRGCGCRERLVRRDRWWGLAVGRRRREGGR